jgi:hypothetical protein
MTLAGALAPVLAGLLTKEPGQRSDHARARAGFTAVLNHTAPPKTTDPLPALPVSPPPMRAHPTAPLRRPPGHTPGPRRSRRRGAVAAAMVGLALLFCVGAYAIGSNFARDTGGGGGGTAGAAQSLRYVSYRHPDGFTVDVPAGWTPRDGTPVRVSNPGKPVWLQLHAETFGSRDPAAVWRAADRSNRNDAGSSARNPEYELVNIRATRAADRSAADWEWTYLRTGESERRHVLSRGVVVAGRSYQFSVSAPESLFDQYRGILDVVANSFRLTSSG